jgi:hypothetical protein
MRAIGLVFIAGLLSACGTVQAAREPVQVDMRNVDLHMSGDVTLHVRQLSGYFVPVDRDVTHLDYKQSYAVAVESGEVAIDLVSLNALMARSTGGRKSNIEHLQLSINGDGTLEQKGVIDSAVNIPFKSKAVLSTTPDGHIRVSTTSVRSLGLPVKPIMKLLHFQMDDLVKVAPGTGVVTDGNDLILDPSLLLPAPTVRGRISRVRIQDDQLVQTFGSGTAKPIAKRDLAPNHIYWRGSQLSFGKLTMSGTDLELVDMDPGDPFDFSIDHWNAQLVAGYSKTLPDRSLRAYMPDFNDLPPARRDVHVGR